MKPSSIRTFIHGLWGRNLNKGILGFGLLFLSLIWSRAKNRRNFCLLWETQEAAFPATLSINCLNLLYKLTAPQPENTAAQAGGSVLSKEMRKLLPFYSG